MYALWKGKKMTPAFMFNMAAIQREREMPPAVRDITKVDPHSLTSEAIKYIFLCGGNASSKSIKDEFEIGYSAGVLLKRQIQAGSIISERLSERNRLYCIKKGLTLADFGL